MSLSVTARLLGVSLDGYTDPVEVQVLAMPFIDAEQGEALDMGLVEGWRRGKAAAPRFYDSDNRYVVGGRGGGGTQAGSRHTAKGALPAGASRC
jgi:hypothetical protein